MSLFLEKHDCHDLREVSFRSSRSHSPSSNQLGHNSRNVHFGSVDLQRRVVPPSFTVPIFCFWINIRVFMIMEKYGGPILTGFLGLCESPLLLSSFSSLLSWMVPQAKVPPTFQSYPCFPRSWEETSNHFALFLRFSEFSQN